MAKRDKLELEELLGRFYIEVHSVPWKSNMKRDAKRFVAWAKGDACWYIVWKDGLGLRQVTRCFSS